MDNLALITGSINVIFDRTSTHFPVTVSAIALSALDVCLIPVADCGRRILIIVGAVIYKFSW